jgi:hypothetical protein
MSNNISFVTTDILSVVKTDNLNFVESENLCVCLN